MTNNIKKTLKIATQAVTFISAFAILFASKALALTAREGALAAKTAEMPADLIGPTGTFTQLTNTVLFFVGIVSVFMLIWGGLRYVISGGDSKKVSEAKNTVLYAIIGLIVALLSFAIVNFVINAVSPVKK